MAPYRHNPSGQANVLAFELLELLDDLLSFGVLEELASVRGHSQAAPSFRHLLAPGNLLSLVHALLGRCCRYGC